MDTLPTTVPTPVPVVAAGPREDLRRYLTSRSDTVPEAGVGTLLGALRTVLGPKQRAAVKMLGTRLVAGRSARRLQQLHASGQPLLLNLGSGTYNAAGWVNVDLWGLHGLWGVHPDVVWDLRRPLPLPDGSVDAVFLEHVLEHLPAPVGLAAMDQAARLLRPGGVVRVSVPDFGRWAREYTARVTGTGTGPDLFDQVRPGRPTDLLALAEVVYDHGHVSVWDAGTLVELLRAAGFVDVEVSAYGQGRVHPVPDAPHRADESLYVEGVRPA
ncbi:methyltransferase domain-containing protein [Klenkia sp. PcliD-1-E]|uniref:class I SAM-dependent methyltransferase n=1 Tax=Klenkia sp. PcliD-1-E TaxID=2954492 RepID=UPI00209773C0|nr:methyltransferase domain-containing protein [Klenkia sp. PcliD-1-E]MCO7220215.1 methyltransferase domain-containing protein [Klenkia sp. PcliD-1-E]